MKLFILVKMVTFIRALYSNSLEKKLHKGMFYNLHLFLLLNLGRTIMKRKVNVQEIVRRIKHIRTVQMDTFLLLVLTHFSDLRLKFFYVPLQA